MLRARRRTCEEGPEEVVRRVSRGVSCSKAHGWVRVFWRWTAYEEGVEGGVVLEGARVLPQVGTSFAPSPGPCVV